MNRSERRAAAARVKAASSSAPADIAELMAQANEAYRARRLAQAEIICKQVLSRAPAHATCLNLLGVVCQTAGRHRPAIKLFAKAIAVDDLDAGFHFNIACSYQAVAERAPAAVHFNKAITLGMGGKKHVEEFVMENAAIRQCIARIADQDPALGNALPFGAGDITAVASDIFLRCALQLTTLHGVMLELFLTKLRAALLRLAGANAFDAVQVDDNVIELLCALAQQCFINEYVFAQTDEETERANRLRDLLTEKLSRGDIVSPLLLAAVAAYFPLHSLHGAKSLLSLPWPERAADLVRMQVREPLEEAEDRPAIPALTAIDDDVSAAVMRQYDENPYPRWTINPFIVRAADRKRQEQAVGDDAAVGENVLIAGCGTGQHPFSNAQYSPQARILAVDISRTALAYARRKTREEGLHNIEYAQADILKLGPIGRTFDRIEAVGVLHHLAEPKEGWRVLLSLLAPNGTMRVGLYSAAARRAVVEARALIAERGYSATAEGIRALRQTIIRGQSTNTLLKIADFYTMSGCRDLLFNVMERRFTIPEIAAFLNQHGLLFHGFELEPAIIEQFQQRYPGAEALTNLDYWHEFEIANPDTFWHMYMFTVSPNERISPGAGPVTPAA
jgi:SAM-dependent methyltransferase/tetratricopeptide (TPR) repeat protein